MGRIEDASIFMTRQSVLDDCRVIYSDLCGISPDKHHAGHP
jgi:hypothetical protein